MRQETGSKIITRKIRESADGRKPGPKSVGKQRARKPNDTAFISNSLASLRLGNKAGTEVFYWHELNDNGIEWAEGTYIEMIDDLWLIYEVMKKSFGVSNVDESEERSNFPSLTLMFLLREGQALLPKGFEFNIDYDGDCGHFITVYSDCDFAECWNVIPIGAAVMKLKTENPEALQLLLLFIRSFCSSTGVDLWWQGHYGSTLDYLDDRALDLKEELEDDEESIAAFKEWLAEIDFYKSGDPSVYEKQISKKPLISNHLILIALRELSNVPEPIVNIITAGCKLMEGYNIQDYLYLHNGESDYDTCLRFDDQHNIIWDVDGIATNEHEQGMNGLAGEGIQAPVWSIQFKKDSTGVINTDEWKSKVLFPKQLSDFFDLANHNLSEFLK